MPVPSGMRLKRSLSPPGRAGHVMLGTISSFQRGSSKGRGKWGPPVAARSGVLEARQDALVIRITCHYINYNESIVRVSCFQRGRQRILRNTPDLFMFGWAQNEFSLNLIFEESLG